MAAKQTAAEHALIRLTVRVQCDFVELEEREGVSHPSHAGDVADAVHDIQRVVAMRLARRVDPGAWSWETQT